MNFVSKVISKTRRVVREQIAGSALGTVVAGKIDGNYILMYHGVTSTGSTQFNLRHTSVHCFRKQIAFLKKYCAVISVDDFFQGKFVAGKSNFALTFDDGYLNNFIYAKPVLEEYKCPATFYITALNQIPDNILWADYVNIASSLTSAEVVINNEVFNKTGSVYYSKDSGKSLYDIIKHQTAGYDYKLQVKDAFSKHVSFQNNPELNEYWQLMSDAQITETSLSPYIKIGSHGFYHNNLGTVPFENAMEELKLSKQYLESLVQYEVQQLAYPDGSYSPRLVNAAQKLGFKIQLAADSYLFNESNGNPEIKKRHGIYTVDSCLNQIFTAIKMSV